MSASHDATALAQSLLHVCSLDGMSPDSLTLLEHLCARGDVDIKMPWQARSQYRHREPFQATLGHAMAWKVCVANYLPHFYKEDTARRLLALDADIFSSRNPKGVWWFWDLLDQWSRVDDPERSGFDTRKEGRANPWAACIVDSLPQAALEGPEAKDRWLLLMQLGLDEAAGVFARRLPKMWSARDDRGQLLLRKAKGAALWEGLIASGIDPFAPPPHDDAPKGRAAQPLWRQVLPQNSRAAPKEGSFREAVEDWLGQKVEEGHPQAQAILDHKLRWISNWLTTPAAPAYPLPTKEQIEQSWGEVLRVLEKQPIQWLAHQGAGWAQPFMSPNPGHPRRWAKALLERPQWLEQAGPACAIAMALLDDRRLDKLPADLLNECCQSPHYETQKQALVSLAKAKTWGKGGPSPEKVESFLVSWKMGMELPAPTTSRPRSRL